LVPSRTARAAQVLVLLPLMFGCGQSSSDPAVPGSGGGAAQGSGGATSTGGNSATGGAEAVGGQATGGEATGGAATGGAATGGQGTGAQTAGGGTGGLDWSTLWGVRCVSWADMNNEPKPGQVGALACPSFFDMELKESEGNCIWEPAQESALEAVPEGSPTGDCCYAIAAHNCR
jgi:hypothetical protein